MWLTVSWSLCVDQFRGTITVDTERNGFVANGIFVQLIYSQAPELVGYYLACLQSVYTTCT